MKQRIVIKRCGLDQFGKDRPAVGPIGKEAEPYDQDEIEITMFDPNGVHIERGPSFDENGEIQYEISMEDFIKQHAEVVANGRPYFIGTVEDLPADPYFRDAWVYDESGSTPKITINLDKAKALQLELLNFKARQRIQELSDPVAAALGGVNAQAEIAKVVDALKKVDMSKLTTPEEVKAFIPQVLKGKDD